MQLKDHIIPTLKLLALSCIPSISSVVACVLAGGAVIGLHLALIIASGSAVPAALDTAGLIVYANVVLQPLATISNNIVLTYAATMLLWGALGWLLYALLDIVAVRWLTSWLATQEPQPLPPGTIIYNPLRQTLLTHIMWRFLIGMSTAALTFSLLPIMASLLQRDTSMFALPTFAAALPVLGGTGLAWAAISYLYIVLLRLYLFRPRILGPDVIEP